MRIGADVRIGGNRAAYAPAGDFIVMPELGQFDEAPAFYSDACARAAHWTGHASRLDRDLSRSSVRDAYAAEELVARVVRGVHVRATSGSRWRRGRITRPTWTRGSECCALTRRRCSPRPRKAQAASDFLLGLAGVHDDGL